MSEDTQHRSTTIPSGATTQDIGADELKQILANGQTANNTFQLQLANTLLLQQMQETQRQQQAQFEQRMRQQEEEHSLRMRQLEESSAVKHASDNQLVRAESVAIDRQWNVNETDGFASNVLREQSRQPDTL